MQIETEKKHTKAPFALLPFPTNKEILQLHVSQSFLIVFHRLTAYPSLTSQDLQPPSSPYFSLITCLQKAPIQMHITNSTYTKSDLLNKKSPLTPKPCFLFSMQVGDHFTK